MRPPCAAFPAAWFHIVFNTTLGPGTQPGSHFNALRQIKAGPGPAGQDEVKTSNGIKWRMT